MSKQSIWRGVGVCCGLGLALMILAMIVLSVWPTSRHTTITLIEAPPAGGASAGAVTRPKKIAPVPAKAAPVPAKAAPAPGKIAAVPSQPVAARIKHATASIEPTLPTHKTTVVGARPPARPAPALAVPAPFPAPSPAALARAAARVHLAAIHPPPKLTRQNRPQLADLTSINTERRFVMAMCHDLAGNLWVGCEDEGIWRLDTRGKWTHFTTKDGLGDDNAYALAVDHQGRIWAGHLNHGVSVYNGQKWQCYEVVGGLSRPDTLSGPLGERVFDIAVCPTDGDVWIATNAGLSRYSPSHDDWSYYTRGMSLVHGKVTVASEPETSNEQPATAFIPSDQVQALAFDAEGNIYCATQCDGMVLARAWDGYSHWSSVRGPDQMPTEPAGQGLPTNLMNDVLVAKDGTIYAATTTGLAWSRDKGLTWCYIRGEDYADKVRGLYAGPPQGWAAKNLSEAMLAAGSWLPATSLLPEDYITCLAQGADGYIWTGYRHKGYAAIDARRGKIYPAENAGVRFVTALLPRSWQLPTVGTYGDGQDIPPQRAPAGYHEDAHAALPQGAAGLSPQALQALVALSGTLPADESRAVSVLADDWRTQGAWLGRYGRYWACLAAMARHDYLWGAGAQPVEYLARIGPHHEPNDSIRYYVHWLHTANPRSLEIPPVYLESQVTQGKASREEDHRQSSWDDHGESYPLLWEGPDTYITLKVPPGAFILALYDMNKDGHQGPNRYRDYLVSVRPHPADKSLSDISDFDAQPELARTRIHQFWGGVYKRFAVRGPGQITIKVSKNNSLSTMVSAVLLDPVEQRMAGYFPPAASATAPAGQPAVDPPVNEALRRLYNVTLLRQSAQDPAPGASLLAQLATAYYQIAAYPQWEALQARQGLTTARQVEKALRWNPQIADYSGRGKLTITEYWSAQQQP